MFAKFTSGVCILLIEREELSYKGLTINSFTSVSLEPLLISFSIKRESKFYHEFDKDKEFSINILSEKQEYIAKQCSISGGSYFSALDILISRAGYLPNCLVTFFCQVREVFNGGDHAIVLCNVTDMLQNQDDSPLVFFNSQYCTLTS